MYPSLRSASLETLFSKFSKNSFAEIGGRELATAFLRAASSDFCCSFLSLIAWPFERNESLASSRLSAACFPLCCPQSIRAGPYLFTVGSTKGRTSFPMSIAFLMSCSLIFPNCAPLFMDNQKFIEKRPAVSCFYQVRKLSHHMQDPLAEIYRQGGRRVIFGCSFDLQLLISVVVAGCAAGVGREREEPHEEPYSEGHESHASASFA